MKRFFVPAAIVAASLVAAVALGELMLRAIGYSAPIWYQPDHNLGWTLRPNLEAWFTTEGRAFVETNSRGLRDREHALDKPANVYRIAVLGDSYSEAMQVPREQAYWALLPERLAACGFAPGKTVEVVNFGVSGYGTAQALRMLESRAAAYRPDLVLLQFTNGNDVSDNSRALTAEKGRPFYRVLADGSLAADDSFAAARAFERRSSFTATAGRRLSDHFRLVQLARMVRQHGLLRPDGLVATASAREATIVEEGLDRGALAPPRDAAWEEAWQVTEALIGRIAYAASRHGARFLAFTVPYAVQVHPDPEVRAAVRDRLGVKDLLYPDTRLAEFGKRTGTPVLPLAPAMQKLADQRGSYFHGFDNVGLGRGHWNAEGHAMAAELIARRLCAPGEGG